jgi:hypothetical protein
MDSKQAIEIGIAAWSNFWFQQEVGCMVLIQIDFRKIQNP